MKFRIEISCPFTLAPTKIKKKHSIWFCIGVPSNDMVFHIFQPSPLWSTRGMMIKMFQRHSTNTAQRLVYMWVRLSYI